MNGLSLAQLLRSTSHALDSADDAVLRDTLLDRLQALRAYRRGTMYIERPLPFATARQDAIILVRPEHLSHQCTQMASQASTQRDADRWSALASVETQSHPDTPLASRGADHYWLELDQQPDNDGPNFFVCRRETSPPVESLIPFLERVQQIERVLILEGLAAIATHDRVNAVLSPPSFVSYVGMMLARRDEALRICVSDIDVKDALRVVKALNAPLGAALCAATSEYGIDGPQGVRTLLHLDWIAGRVRRTGIEAGAVRFAPLHEQTPWLQALCARCAPEDQRWIERAVIGDGVQVPIAHGRFVVTRSLNHLKLVVDDSGRAAFNKAYVRYDWKLETTDRRPD
jgi:hypothetical protein